MSHPWTATRAALLLALGSVLVGQAPAAPAQEFGRLFTTPEERATLDELRREYELGEPLAEAAPTVQIQEQADPVVSQLTINGIVLRSSGVNSTWINGRQVLGGDATREGLRVETRADSGGRVRITLPSGVDTVQLKPGQKIDVITGSVLEAYQFKAAEDDRSAFDLEPEASVDGPAGGVESTEAPAEAGPAAGSGAPPPPATKSPGAS